MPERASLSPAGGTLAGLLLFTLPFLQYGSGTGHAAGCAMDHLPRHGGRLWMLGEVHLELVERDDRLELYVSDLARRPMRVAWATAAFDDGDAATFSWQGYRLVAARPASAAGVLLQVGRDASVPLSIRLPLAGQAAQPTAGLPPPASTRSVPVG